VYTYKTGSINHVIGVYWRVFRGVLHLVLSLLLSPPLPRAYRMLGLRVKASPGVFDPYASRTSILLARVAMTIACKLKPRLCLEPYSGTGLAALVMSLAGCSYTIASDLDSRAVECSWQNAKSNKLDHIIDVAQAPNLSYVRRTSSLTLVAANPPYKECRRVGPSDPVCAGENGELLDLFRRQALSILAKGVVVYTSQHPLEERHVGYKITPIETIYLNLVLRR